MDYNCFYYHYLLFTVTAEAALQKCFSNGGCQSWHVAILLEYIEKAIYQYFSVPLLMSSYRFAEWFWREVPFEKRRGWFFHYY